jgi:hypothetical protein
VSADLPFDDPMLWGHLAFNAVISPRCRLLYVATPKVACTGIKWWMAMLEGRSEAVAAFPDSLESSPELVVHDALPRVAPDLTGLGPEALTGPLTDHRWLRFAVVRNPFRRIFSAWQSKLLLQEPLQSEPYADLPFYARAISSAEDVREAFEGFLAHLAEHEAPSTFADPHWTPQVALLRPDLIHYDLIGRIEAPTDLETLLKARLGPGVPSPFAERPINESLIPWSPDLLTARAVRLILELYAEDFAAFGYSATLPSSQRAASSAELEVALRAVSLIRGRHRRLAATRSLHLARIREQEAALLRAEDLWTERQGEIARLAAELERARAQVQEQAAELQRAGRLWDEQQEEITRLDGELERARAQVQEQAVELQRAGRLWDEQQEEITRLGAELERARAQVQEQAAELQHAGRLWGEQQAEIQRLGALLAQARAAPDENGRASE